MNIKVKSLLIIFLMSTSSAVFAKHYYRFWRGHIAPNMSETEFVKGLNKIFIPETVEQGKNDGLNSYLPVLISRSNSITQFPDELALVVYDSEEKYRAIRKMPRGNNYQKLHWVYFNKENSKSLVPKPYLGEVETEKAYDLLESNANWQEGRVQFLEKKFKSGFTTTVKIELKKYFESMKKNSKDNQILSHLILVDRLGMYEYILYKKEIRLQVNLLTNSKEILTEMNLTLKNENVKINFNEGVNRQFTVK